MNLIEYNDRHSNAIAIGRNGNVNRTWKSIFGKLQKWIIERIERSVLRSDRQLKHAIKEAGTRPAEENEISE